MRISYQEIYVAQHASMKVSANQPDRTVDACTVTFQIPGKSNHRTAKLESLAKVCVTLIGGLRTTAITGHNFTFAHIGEFQHDRSNSGSRKNDNIMETLLSSYIPVPLNVVENHRSYHNITS